MKKILFILFITAFVFTFSIVTGVKLYAQEKDNPTNKGTYILSNGLDFTYAGGPYNQGTDSKGKKYSPWSITLNPSLEYFTFNTIAFGGTVNYQYQSKGADTGQLIGFGPIISYYMGRWTTIIPYISIFATYNNSLVYLGVDKSMHWADKVYIGGAKLGVVLMMSRQVGLFIEANADVELHTVDKSLETPAGTGSETKLGYSGSALIGVKYFIF